MEGDSSVWQVTYGCRPKSVNVDFDCGIGCTLALSVMTGQLGQHMWQLWCYKNKPYPYLLVVSAILAKQAGLEQTIVSLHEIPRAI